jgi:hypothetical protein
MKPRSLWARRRDWAITLLVLMGWVGTVAAQSREQIDHWRSNYRQLKPTDDPRAKQAHDIFHRLVKVAGKTSGHAPQLFIVASNPWDIALPIALPDGWVVLSKNVLDICYQEPSQGDDRLAFVLAHEIAHQLKDDFWHIRFFQAFDKSPTKRSSEVEKIRQLMGTPEQVSARELQADEHGIIYAAMAGFNTRAIVTADGSVNFFADWVRAIGRLEGVSVEQMRPTPKERAEALRVRLRQVVDRTALFQAGVWWYYAGNYQQAIRLLEQFQRTFPSPEVSHNLATSHHQLALQAYQVWKKDAAPLPFHLALAIDPLTRASQIALAGPTRRAEGTPAPSPEAQFREHLNRAITLYQEVLKQENSYVASALNLASALLVRGDHSTTPGLKADFYEAVTVLQRALEYAPHAPETPAILNTLGVALWYVGQPEQAKEYLARAQSLAPTYAAPACNLAVLTQASPWIANARPHEYDCPPPVRPSASAPSVNGQRPEQVMGLTIGRLQDQVPAQWGTPAPTPLEVDNKRLTVTAYPVGTLTLAQEKEILMIVVQEGARASSASSEKGITIGSPAQAVLAAYGPPVRQIATTRGESWSYEAPRIAFQFRDGQVVSWLVF